MILEIQDSNMMVDWWGDDIRDTRGMIIEIQDPGVSSYLVLNKLGVLHTNWDRHGNIQ